MSRWILVRVVVATALVGLFLGNYGRVQARTYATAGDAAAVFNTLLAGGGAIRAHSPVGLGSPVGTGIVIRPFSVFDGTHYCQLDWKVIAVAELDGSSSSGKLTLRDVAAEYSQVQLTFILDGVPLTTTQTPFKPILDQGVLNLFGLEAPAYYRNTGSVLAPQDLTVGAHTLEVIEQYPGGSDNVGPITFYVDAAGTGACL